MNSNLDLESTDPTLDEIPAEDFSADPIGVTFAGGVHQRDLLSFLECAQRLAREVC